MYTLAAAARLIHADRGAVKRWLFGYDYTRQHSDGRRQHHSDPLWTPQHSNAALGEKVIGFRDLLELRIVKEFVQHGVSMLVVRRCLEFAKAEFGMADYPFTSQRFCTDGRTIFREVLRDGQEPEILDLRSRQYVIREIIKPSLYSGIEYDGEMARRWYPEGRDRKTIVVDPAMQFGKPVLKALASPRRCSTPPTWLRARTKRQWRASTRSRCGKLRPPYDSKSGLLLEPEILVRQQLATPPGEGDQGTLREGVRTSPRRDCAQRSVPSRRARYGMDGSAGQRGRLVHRFRGSVSEE